MTDWLDLYDNELIVLVGGDRDYVPVHKEIEKIWQRHSTDGSTIWEHLLRSAGGNNLGNGGGGDG
ncbi:unnamed protein product [Arabidopsis halleri]